MCLSSDKTVIYIYILKLHVSFIFGFWQSYYTAKCFKLKRCEVERVGNPNLKLQKRHLRLTDPLSDGRWKGVSKNKLHLLPKGKHPGTSTRWQSFTNNPPSLKFVRVRACVCVRSVRMVTRSRGNSQETSQAQKRVCAQPETTPMISACSCSSDRTSANNEHCQQVKGEIIMKLQWMNTG